MTRIIQTQLIMDREDLISPRVEERARSMIGQTVEVIHSRADMGPGDEPFRSRGKLLGIDPHYLWLDTVLIPIVSVEGIKLVSR